MTMTQQLSFSLRLFPGLPDEHPKRSEMIDLLIDAQRLGLELNDEPDADFEDFWEDAYRAACAVRACEKAGLPWVLEDKTRWRTEELSTRLGPVFTSEVNNHAADPLLRHPLVTAYSGREITFVTAFADPAIDQESLVDACIRYAAAGHTHIVVKDSGTKKGIWRIPVVADPVEMDNQLIRHDGIGWAQVVSEGRKDAFVVSEVIPMTNEYRVFVIDGVAVSGAGCIEEFTPLDNLGADFDPQMRAHRGNGIAADDDSPVRSDPALRDRYLDFINEHLIGLAPEDATVVIDLALNTDTDEIVVIEANSVSNAGLYASNPQAIFDALVATANRGYQLDRRIPFREKNTRLINELP